ncbi:MAG TPA: hypothetical protein VN796_10805 [Acidimicrobiales bacterium]|nr:hypothetical protein [Acidimicrobiales bacterium]
MALIDTLSAARDDVLQQASDSLERTHLPHYEASGTEESRRRLNDLFDLVLVCLTKRDLDPITHYAHRVAEERFGAGFGIAEVQTAFNVLEEAIWRAVIARLPAQELLESAGLIGTVLGAGKDALARTWVASATSTHVPSLDLTALFEGLAN